MIHLDLLPMVNARRLIFDARPLKVACERNEVRNVKVIRRVVITTLRMHVPRLARVTD